MLIRAVETQRDLIDILTLQKKNTKTAIPLEEIETQGFVTVEHSLRQLENMQAKIPQIVAVKNQMLAGYALSMTRELKVNIPVLIPLFERLDSLFYNGRAVKDLSYYVMGQICVDKAFRGQGVFRQLYASHKALLSGQYNYCITEVSTRNLRSMQAHYAIGFELLHRFSDTQDEWNIVLWDWTK
jgi:predicted GNAT superfamily acetyltransferase